LKKYGAIWNNSARVERMMIKSELYGNIEATFVRTSNTALVCGVLQATAHPELTYIGETFSI
jgi:hypothetical protein